MATLQPQPPEWIHTAPFQAAATREIAATPADTPSTEEPAVDDDDEDDWAPTPKLDEAEAEVADGTAAADTRTSRRLGACEPAAV